MRVVVDSAAPADPLAALDPVDPYPAYEALRVRGRIVWSNVRQSWMLTHYADVMGILDHPDFRVEGPVQRLSRLTVRGGPDLPFLKMVYDCIALLADPARSAGMKRVFGQLLANWRALGLREKLARKAAALLEAGAARGEIDLAAGYARPIAVYAFGTLMGLPESENAAMAASKGIVSVVGRVLHSLHDLRRLDAEAGILIERFHRLIASQATVAGDDTVSRLVRAAQSEYGWTHQQVAGLCAFLLGAARETTSTSIAASAQILLGQPELAARLRAMPELRPAAVRELLRLISPFQYVSRFAIRETAVAGQAVAAGQGVCAVLAAANRDSAAFPDPGSIVLDRRGAEPVSFSHGHFRCLGEQLATLEVAVALDQVLAYRNLKLAAVPATWGPSTHIRELLHLPATFDAEGAGDEK